MSAKGLRAPPYRVSPEITEADLRGGSAGAVGTGIGWWDDHQANGILMPAHDFGR